jgi:S-disulfanyl-L-cysteine oxidoreductase SoxD
MRCFYKLLVLLAALTAGNAAWAQAPNYKNVGRAPTSDEIRAWDTAVGPAGKELPPGSGTAKEGAEIFAEKCVVCHGPAGEGSQMAPRLVGGKGTLTTPQPVLTVGSYWAFATTIFDFIYKAMPRGQEGSLKPGQAYALTAFLLYKNDIIKETDTIDAKTLPAIKMPNRDGFIPPQLEDIHDIKKRGCRLGHCP